MEAPDWLMLRCGACREELKIPRGIAAVYVRCPSCSRVVSVPGGVLDPAKRFQVFDTEVAELPEVEAGDLDAIVSTIDVPEMRFGKPVGGTARKEAAGGAIGSGGFEATVGAGKPKVMRKTEEFAKAPSELGGRSSRAQGQRGRRRGSDLPVWDTTASRGRGSSEKLAKRFVQLAVVGIVVLGGGLGVMIWMNKDVENGVGDVGVKWELAPVDAGGDVVLGASGDDNDLAVVIEGVEAFYAAETVAELKRTVRDVERVGPLIDAYYGEDGFERMLVRSVAESRLPVEEYGLMRVPVVLADRTEKEVYGEEVGGRFLVDWESYVGHAAIAWTDLVVKKPREEVTLRVWVRADNYYNYDFSDEVALGCWRLSAPDRQVQIYGYAPRASDLAKMLDQTLEGGEKAMMLTFRYPEVARESRQVSLTAVAGKGWVVK